MHMKKINAIVLPLLLFPLVMVRADGFMLTSPLDYQVVQRQSADKGRIEIAGDLGIAAASTDSIEVRISDENVTGEWQRVVANMDGSKFHAAIEAKAGGWYRVEVRAKQGDAILASALVEHVGIGEIFVVAGQSNAANHGAEKQN